MEPGLGWLSVDRNARSNPWFLSLQRLIECSLLQRCEKRSVRSHGHHKSRPLLFLDATEKVLILCKAAQDKVYLYVLRYYILYVKTAFQWCPLSQTGVCVLPFFRAAGSRQKYHDCDRGHRNPPHHGMSSLQTVSLGSARLLKPPCCRLGAFQCVASGFPACHRCASTPVFSFQRSGERRL